MVLRKEFEQDSAGHRVKTIFTLNIERKISIDIHASCSAGWDTTVYQLLSGTWAERLFSLMAMVASCVCHGCHYNLNAFH